MLRVHQNTQLPKGSMKWIVSLLFHPHLSLSLPLLLQIALQFPDFLLPDAAKVSAELQREFAAEKQFFILGDTSYGRYTGVLNQISMYVYVRLM